MFARKLIIALFFLATVCQCGLAGSAPSFADVLRELPELDKDAKALPDPAIIPRVFSAAAAVGSESIKSNVEEYAVGAILVAKGPEAMQKAKDMLGIKRTTRIERECTVPCVCANANKCLKCVGTGKCNGRCNHAPYSLSGLTNGTYRHFILLNPYEAKVKSHNRLLTDENHNCSQRFDGSCAGQLHTMPNPVTQSALYYYLEMCPDCKGSGVCPVCGGSGRVGGTGQKSCQKCKGRGFTLDRQRAREMLARTDRWLRETMASDEFVNEKIEKALVRIEGDVAGCAGICVEMEGRKYVAAPAKVLVANQGIRLNLLKGLTGSPIEYGGIRAAYGGVVIFDVFPLESLPSISVLNAALANEAMVSVFCVDASSNVVSKTSRSVNFAAKDGPIIARIAETTLAGSPVVTTEGVLVGLTSDEGPPRVAGAIRQPLCAKGGRLLRLDGLSPSGMSEVSIDKLERQNALLRNLEQRLLTASNTLVKAWCAAVSNNIASAANALTPSQESVLPTNMVALCRSLADEAVGEKGWCIREMGEFAATLRSAAYDLAVMAAKLEVQYAEAYVNGYKTISMSKQLYLEKLESDIESLDRQTQQQVFFYRVASAILIVSGIVALAILSLRRPKRRKESEP